MKTDSGREGGIMIGGGCVGFGLPWQLLHCPQCYVLPLSAEFSRMTKAVPVLLRYLHY